MKKIDQMRFSLSFLGRMLMTVIVFKCLYCGNVEWPVVSSHSTAQTKTLWTRVPRLSLPGN